MQSSIILLQRQLHQVVVDRADYPHHAAHLDLHLETTAQDTTSHLDCQGIV
jgi:hypothetical protein